MSFIKKIRNFTYVVLLIFNTFNSARGTHIKAGEFNAKRSQTDPLTYEFTLKLYLQDGGAPQPFVDMVFSDGRILRVDVTNQVSVGNNTTQNTYITTYTFNAPGFYRVSIDHSWRNDRVINIPNSGKTDFYIELGLLIDPLIGLNQTPILTIPPVDIGGINKLYKHNPGAYDPNGDSISYKLVTPLSGANQIVPNYTLPNNPSYGGTAVGGGAATLTLNSQTGDLIWNTPSSFGSTPRFYNVAIMVEEWRFGIRTSYLIRDMQIEIVPTLNDPPIITLPMDTCIVAETTLSATFTAVDPNGDAIELEAFGSPFNVPSSPATQIPQTNAIQFQWNTNCSHVRIQPYDVVVQASDINNVPTLVDYKTWRIFVKAPPIQNVTASSVGNSIQLNWSPYSCTNASTIKIYRAICSTILPPISPCATGVPPGYALIGEVPVSINTFTDNNNGSGIPVGVTYCYVLVAQFPLPSGGESKASVPACAALPLRTPVLAEVSVLQTAALSGETFLRWYPPYEPSLVGPFQYIVERSTGYLSSTFTAISPVLSDTFYFDSNINTLDTDYTYRIRFVNTNEVSTVVPTTRLLLTSLAGNVRLNWSNGAPWGIDSTQIFISTNNNPFVWQTTLSGSLSNYLLPTGSAYCDTIRAYVKTFGKYCDPILADSTLQTSAIRSIVPIDDRIPPAPRLSVLGCSTSGNIDANLLSWTRVAYTNCNTITGYKVYFSSQLGQPYRLIASLTDTFFLHTESFSTAGCYKVVAINRDDVEGTYSQEICVDDCFYYELPNLLTLNNDGKNDLFEPFPVPYGVQQVTFSVYNRWGDLVYRSESPLDIRWEGKTSKGPLSDGVYYFTAEIRYNRRLDPKDETRIVKSWVHIIQNGNVPTK
jgi:gliding motility-associated-like protein